MAKLTEISYNQCIVLWVLSERRLGHNIYTSFLQHHRVERPCHGHHCRSVNIISIPSVRSLSTNLPIQCSFLHLKCNASTSNLLVTGHSWKRKAEVKSIHDDVIKWKHFPRNWPFVRAVNSQRSVTRSFDIFFDLRLNKRLSEQSWGWWFETLSCPLWRHRNDCTSLINQLMYHLGILSSVPYSANRPAQCYPFPQTLFFVEFTFYSVFNLDRKHLICWESEFFSHVRSDYYLGKCI